MTQRLLQTPVLAVLAAALLLAVAPAGSNFVHTGPRGSIGAWLGSGPSQASAQSNLVEKIVFSSTRNNPLAPLHFNIFLMDPDGTHPEQLTDSTDCPIDFVTCGNAFPALSPNGKQIVFDSNRNKAAAAPLNTSDLFVMKSDGKEQTFLAQGSSVSWSPGGKVIAFHRSVSGTGEPINLEAGAPYPDSDIFVMNISAGEGPTNITNTPGLIEDDANWSPDGRQIVYVRQLPDPIDPTKGNPTTAELYVLTVSADGAPVQGPDNPRRLTINTQEERGPAWFPDGRRIAYDCRMVDFEICVVNADGTGGVTVLTDNPVFDGVGSWSLDGQHLLVNRPVTGARNQIFRINANGAGEFQVTNTPAGTNLWPAWGVVRVVGRTATPTPTSTSTATPTATATNTPTETPVPPTETPVPPTQTPAPPTDTPEPPAETPAA